MELKAKKSFMLHQQVICLPFLHNRSGNHKIFIRRSVLFAKQNFPSIDLKHRAIYVTRRNFMSKTKFRSTYKSFHTVAVQWKCTLWINLNTFLWWFKNRYANFIILSWHVLTTILSMVTTFNYILKNHICHNRKWIWLWIECKNADFFRKWIRFCQRANIWTMSRQVNLINITIPISLLFQIKSQLSVYHSQELQQKRNLSSVKISFCTGYSKIYSCHKVIQIVWVRITFIINSGTQFKPFARQ